MPNKKSYIQVKHEFDNKGLILDDKEYINSKSSLMCHDKNGYFYSLSYNDIRDKRTKNFDIISPYNQFSIKNIQIYLDKHKSGVKILSTQYIRNNQNLLFQCECGNIYMATWNHILNSNKLQCSDCGCAIKVKKRITPNEIVKKELKNYGLELMKFDNNIHQLVIKNKDGYMCSADLHNIRNNEQPCWFHKKNPFTTYNLSKYLQNNNIELKLLDIDLENIGVNDYLNFQCKCGNSFLATITQVMYEKRYRCPKCVNSISGLELKVKEFLDFKKIKYEQQKTFSNCKNIRCLRFDFYLSDYNCCIEVNGKQHYYKNQMFNIQLDEQRQRDEFKKQYCIDNDIKYVEIPFWKIQNSDSYKKIIDEILE